MAEGNTNGGSSNIATVGGGSPSSGVSYGSLFQDVGGATSDLFAAYGAFQSAKSYGEAASQDLQNEQLQKQITNLQEVQASRKIGLQMGTEQADVAGAGFSSGGSAQDLLRSSAEQGALEKQAINMQGIMKENEFAQQALAAKSEQKAAKTSGYGEAIGAAIQVASVAAMFL